MSLGWGCENGTLEGYTRALRTRGGLGEGSTRDVLPGEGGLASRGVAWLKAWEPLRAPGQERGLDLGRRLGWMGGLWLPCWDFQFM